MDEVQKRRLLAVGLLASIVTVIGEMLGGFAPSSEVLSPAVLAVTQWLKGLLGNRMAGMLTPAVVTTLSSFENLSVWQIGLGATLGGLGILAQYLGYWGIDQYFDNRDSKIGRLYRFSNIGYTILGSMIHILCSMLTYVYMVNAQSPDCWQVVGAFSLWFVAPIALLFFIGYGVLAITLFLQLYRKHTVFPRWFCLLNPVLLGKGLVRLLVTVIPASPLSNGVAYSNMGLASVVLFGALLVYVRKSSCLPTARRVP